MAVAMALHSIAMLFHGIAIDVHGATPCTPAAMPWHMPWQCRGSPCHFMGFHGFLRAFTGFHSTAVGSRGIGCHGNCMKGFVTLPRKRPMAVPLPCYSTRIGIPWHRPDTAMAVPWQCHDCAITTPWQYHDIVIAVAWHCHDDPRKPMVVLRRSIKGPYEVSWWSL